LRLCAFRLTLDSIGSVRLAAVTTSTVYAVSAEAVEQSAGVVRG
jgi:hypothetical protein